MAEVRAVCGVGECCGKCARQARELIVECVGSMMVSEVARSAAVA